MELTNFPYSPECLELEERRSMRTLLVAAVVVVAVGVSLASSTRTPTYEASAQVRVDQVQGDQQTYVTGSGE